MANVHGLGSYGRQRDELPGPGPARLSQNPADITFIEFICPGFRIKSSIVVLSIIQVGVFIATLCYGFLPGLKPSPAALIDFGAADAQRIAPPHWELWRLVCPIFLHADPFHILFNVYFQIRMGLPAEAKYGQRKFLMLYFVTGIVGNIFSSCVNPCGSIKVGASTAGFGLIGIQLAETLLDWHRITNKEQVVMNLLMFVLMMVLFTFGIPHLDVWGHLGGCLGGLALGIILNENLEDKPSWYQRGRLASILGLSFGGAGCLVKTFLDSKCY